MSKEIDILNIHEAILNNFKKEKIKIKEYKNKLKDVLKSLEKNNKIRINEMLTENKEYLETLIQDLENDKYYNFYISEVTEIIETYKNILYNPVKINFIGKSTKNNKDKDILINQYINIANKYIDTDSMIKYEKKNKEEINHNKIKFEKIICKNCKNRKDFDIIEDNIYACVICSAQQIVMKNVSSYKDIDRINITSKYVYDRKLHFKDCINQYQGKQNSLIPKKVYEDLEEQFRLHGLLLNCEEEKFGKILKEHINIFLKELEYSKHYENVNLIYYNLTGKKLDDISHLENKLIEDFNILTDCYDKNFKFIDRKNFINTQYVLFQLLIKNKHPCNKEDFTILKTIERKNYHDDIMRECFETLGWSFIPIE